MLLAALLACSLIADAGPSLPVEGPPPPAELSELRHELIATLNEHRSQYNLPRLSMDRTAEKSAQAHAEDMLRTGQMQHDDPSGRTPFERFQAYGGKADYFGENLGFHSPGVIDPVLLWQVIEKLDAQMMAETPPSDGHRRNILSRNFSEVGIGIAVGSRGVFLSEDFVGYLYEKSHTAKSDATPRPRKGSRSNSFDS